MSNIDQGITPHQGRQLDRSSRAYPSGAWLDFSIMFGADAWPALSG